MINISKVGVIYDIKADEYGLVFYPDPADEPWTVNLGESGLRALAEIIQGI